MLRTIIYLTVPLHLFASVTFAEVGLNQEIPKAVANIINAAGPVAVDYHGSGMVVAWKYSSDDMEPVNLYIGDQGGRGVLVGKVAIGNPRAISKKGNIIRLITTVTDAFGTDVIFTVDGKIHGAHHFSFSSATSLSFGFDVEGKAVVLSIDNGGIHVVAEDGSVHTRNIDYTKLPSDMQARIAQGTLEASAREN